MRGLEVTGKDTLAPALANPTARAASEAILGEDAGESSRGEERCPKTLATYEMWARFLTSHS